MSNHDGDDARGHDPLTHNPVLGSIIIIIVVMLVTTTTLTTSYSAHFAAEGSATSISTGPTLASSLAEISHTGSSTSPAVVNNDTDLLSWSTSTGYPTEIWLQSCVASKGDIYCVGGENQTASPAVVNSVYYASISTTGSGQWTATTNYPLDVRSESCVVSPTSMIYCVGGYNSTSSLDDVYFTTLSSSGVGRWATTTSYPLSVGTESCAASTVGVYCVGGSSSYQVPTDEVFFAPFLSSGGLGDWVGTTNYPTEVRQQSCVATSSDLYCIGGYDQTAVYHAPLTSSGIGQWTAAPNYPFSTGANLLSCTTSGNVVFCVDGHTGPNTSSAVYRAVLSASGVGEWVADASYPVAVWGLSCVAYDNTVYCVGGEDAANDITSDSSFSQIA